MYYVIDTYAGNEEDSVNEFNTLKESLSFIADMKDIAEDLEDMILINGEKISFSVNKSISISAQKESVIRKVD